MSNAELYDAIAFAYQSALNAADTYDKANNERARTMLQHLKELLSVQLTRAKQGAA